MQGNRDNVPLGTGQTASLSLEDIRFALQGLHYGAVEITVHNGQIVQIERKEKLRASSAPARHKTELTRPAY